MRAFFARTSEKANSQKSVEDEVKEEYKQRKALKIARLKMQAAIESATRSVKSAEEIAAQVRAVSEKHALEEAEEARHKLENEMAVRAARKAALNAKWSVAFKYNPEGQTTA
jgi:alpha-beta hydrolase superfamily lysophospholipase